jgi:hypothetical protein
MVQRIVAPTLIRSGVGGRVLARIAALLRRAEPVELIAQRYNFLPYSFRWRGDLRRVRVVARVWEDAGRPFSAVGMAARPPRRYFEVRCGEGGSYVLFQDLRLGTWHMSV